mgnify:CR=1 FL=1|tara:strand:+ start:138 stop:1220 length:1083 start_codon:yes stop_codon:yes gene_type:complete
MEHRDFYSLTLETTYWANNHLYESSDDYVDDLLEEIKISRGKSDKDFLLVATNLWEMFLLDDMHLWKELFDSFKRKGIDTLLVLDSCFKKKDTSTLDTEICFINFFIWRTCRKVLDHSACGHNQRWNNDSKKFLMLIGKPHRQHRIRLLWKLDNLLDNATWSLHVHPGTYEQCRALIPELDDQQFADFVKSRNRNPDDIEIQLLSNTTHYGGIPYDPGLYANTLFAVVSECHFNTTQDRPPWLTEKTFIPILNKVPFIIAGDNGSLATLKGLGFRTFEQYLPFPNYDSISDKSRKIDAVLENTQFWITNMKDTTSIAEDIAHNHLRLLELYARNKQTLMAMCDKHNLDKNRIDEIINPDL